MKTPSLTEEEGSYLVRIREGRPLFRRCMIDVLEAKGLVVRDFKGAVLPGDINLTARGREIARGIKAER